MGIKLPGFAKKLLGGIAGEIPVVGGLISDALTKADDEFAKLPPEERAAMERRLAELELEHFRTQVQNDTSIRELAAIELQSDDRVVRWVRPAQLWLLGFIALFWLIIVPAANGFGATINPPDISALPGEFWATFFGISATYGGYREFGKTQKLKHLNGRK